MQSLDARGSYNISDVTQLFDDMGKEGMDIYSFVSGEIDMIYPLVYALLFFLIIIALTKRFNGKWLSLSFIPFVAMLFDYLENFNVLKLMNNHPNFTEEEVQLASTFTQLKWGAILITLLTIVIFLIILGIKKIVKK